MSTASPVGTTMCVCFCLSFRCATTLLNRSDLIKLTSSKLCVVRGAVAFWESDKVGKSSSMSITSSRPSSSLKEHTTNNTCEHDPKLTETIQDVFCMGLRFCFLLKAKYLLTCYQELCFGHPLLGGPRHAV